MKYTGQQHNMIVDTVRAVFEKLKHHEIFGSGKRFETALIKALGNDYTIYCARECGCLGKISVWGNGATYDSRLSFCFNLNLDTPGGWAPALDHEIQRVDSRDVQERETQEAALDVEFSKAELMIEALNVRIAGIRADALKQIAALPKPKSATLRTSDCHWNSPTTKTRAQYPTLFNS